MENKDYMKKVYKNFSDFIYECSSHELEYFILDSKFTTSFNQRVKELIDEIKEEGKKSIELSIIYNTEGEIALIDSYVIGNYIGNNYTKHMQEYYKENSLNKIVKYIVNGNEKSKRDFLILSYDILYNTLNSVYSEVKCKRETLNNYVQSYNLKHCQNDDCSIVVISILILEDISKYLSIEGYILAESIRYTNSKRNSQEA